MFYNFVASVLIVSVLTPLTSIYVQPREESKSPIELSNSTAPVSTEPSTPSVGVVEEISHKELKWPKYTIRLWLDGKRKNIPRITWETIDDRAKQLLDTAWIWYTLPTWKKLWEKYKIDYTLPIAIAWSDSHLWLALKSKNNVGNVGNNDRWETREYATIEQGIEAIFWHLTYGTYMKGHTTLSTLSWEWRKRTGKVTCSQEKIHTQKCYASSATHWSTNVVNMLSVLHNEQVDENFLFRK